MVFNLIRRRSSQSSAVSSSSTSSSTSSQSSTSSFYSPLEPVEGSLPRELYETSKSITKKAVKCSLDVEREAWSNPFSFPRSHTHHHVCPKHGIRHDPFLALPGREERSFECGQYKAKKINLRKTKTNKS